MKDLIPFEEAYELKELEFDEECFGFYDTEGLQITYHASNRTNKNSLFIEHGTTNNPKISAPTFSQAFRFFREKYGLYHVSHIVRPYNDPEEEYPEEVWIGKVCQSDREQFVNTDNGLAHNHFYTYEEAELACLKELIKLVKQK